MLKITSSCFFKFYTNRNLSLSPFLPPSLSLSGRGRPCQGEGVDFLQTFPPPSPLSSLEVLWIFLVTAELFSSCSLLRFSASTWPPLAPPPIIRTNPADMDWGTDLWVSLTADTHQHYPAAPDRGFFVPRREVR